MLKGKKVNLRAVEREDLDLLTKWFNDPEFVGIRWRISRLSSSNS